VESTQKESVFSQARAAEEGDDSLPSMFDLPFGEGKVRVTYDYKLRMIILPRQARDNHRKSCEKEWRYIYIMMIIYVYAFRCSRAIWVGRCLK
jgi:hypothetical protein